jgi:hypothetical protein
MVRTPLDDRTAQPAYPPQTLGGSLNGAAHSANALAPGTRLAEFEILGVVAEGGFGIVYAAHDHSLERRVALKEYMPQTLASRVGATEVRVKSQRHLDTFEAGLRSFVNEARLLAQFDHPSLVKVYRFWEANGTAYMAMPLYEGAPLKEVLTRRREPVDEAWLRQLLARLMEALAVLHRERCYHRDVAPDNILLLRGGRPVLLDFGAARRVIGDMTQALTVIVKPGYAPIEQYADAPNLTQGPWTDIYALAAVAYFAITGSTPVPAVARMVSDPLQPLSKIASGRYSAGLLAALDRALAVKPQDRPQSLHELAQALGLSGLGREAGEEDREPVFDHVPAPKSRSRMTLLAGATAIAAIVAVAVAVFELARPAPGARQADSAPPASAAARAEPAAAPAVPRSPPAKSFDPVRALDEVFQARNRDHGVVVSLERAQVRIGRDPLRFTIRTTRPGYVYLLMVGTERAHFHLLFPNAIDRDNRIGAGQDLALPRPSWQLVPEGPPGMNHFVAIVSESPRDFRAAGLRDAAPFAEFPLEDARGRYADYTGGVPLFAGRARCEPGPAVCPDSFGAVLFAIEETRG